MIEEKNRILFMRELYQISDERSDENDKNTMMIMTFTVWVQDGTIPNIRQENQVTLHRQAAGDYS